MATVTAIDHVGICLITCDLGGSTLRLPVPVGPLVSPLHPHATRRVIYGHRSPRGGCVHDMIDCLSAEDSRHADCLPWNLHALFSFFNRCYRHGTCGVQGEDCSLTPPAHHLCEVDCAALFRCSAVQRAFRCSQTTLLEALLVAMQDTKPLAIHSWFVQSLLPTRRNIARLRSFDSNRISVEDTNVFCFFV